MYYPSFGSFLKWTKLYLREIKGTKLDKSASLLYRVSTQEII